MPGPPDPTPRPPSREVAKLLDRNAFWKSRRGRAWIGLMIAVAIGVPFGFLGWSMAGAGASVGAKLGGAAVSVLAGGLLAARIWSLVTVE